MEVTNLLSAYEILKPLIFFIVGIVIYSIFIFHFYRFLARKNIFKLDLEKYNTSKHPFIQKTVSTFFYIIEYLLFVPLLIFFWFGVLTLLISSLADSPTFETITLMAMSVVAAVRITSYYHEDLSRDLAKMLPFALLGVFIIDSQLLTFGDTWSIIKQSIDNWLMLIYYFLFVVLIEFAMRIIYALSTPFRKKKEKKSEEN
jgi:hypothetical protein